MVWFSLVCLDAGSTLSTLQRAKPRKNKIWTWFVFYTVINTGGRLGVLCVGGTTAGSNSSTIRCCCVCGVCALWVGKHMYTQKYWVLVSSIFCSAARPHRQGASSTHPTYTLHIPFTHPGFLWMCYYSSGVISYDTAFESFGTQSGSRAHMYKLNARWFVVAGYRLLAVWRVRRTLH